MIIVTIELKYFRPSVPAGVSTYVCVAGVCVFVPRVLCVCVTGICVCVYAPRVFVCERLTGVCVRVVNRCYFSRAGSVYVHSILCVYV